MGKGRDAWEVGGAKEGGEGGESRSNRVTKNRGRELQRWGKRVVEEEGGSHKAGRKDVSE